ncbi:MAG: roadblock/LC7 domain-containing protein [Candidatus Bathyarchaeota archaeon]|nr:roadblock/LC7 domain-containing protein [Candidatus Bathyarchaeota archaeon]
MSTKSLIDEILRGLKSVGGVVASAVVTRDGLLVSSDTSPDVDAETFAAMSASMMGAAETAIIEVKGGNAGRVIVESNNSKMIALGAGPKVLLVVLASKEIQLGLILLKLNDAARKISSVVDL